MTTKPSNATSSRFDLDQVTLAVGFVAAAVAGAGWATDHFALTRAALCVVQATSLLMLMRQGMHSSRGWTSAAFIVGAAWAAIFLVPSLIYTVRPSIFDVPDLTATLAVVTISTTAFVLTYLLIDPGPAELEPVRLTPAEPSWIAAGIGYAIGLAALAALAYNAGGPVEYLTNLDATAGANAGLWYVVAVTMLLRWVPAAIIAQRWSDGRPAGRWVLAAFAGGTLLLTLTGARLFLVIAILELAVLWSLLVRPIPVRKILIWGLVAGVAIVFGLGSVKRYQSASGNGSTSKGFVDYATSTAITESATAYANNYVDSVRLLGLALAVVPELAPYEGIRPLKELVLKPIPSSVRPEIPRSRTISHVFSPPGDTAYAVSLQTNALLAGGVAVLLAISLLLGVLTSLADRAMRRATTVPAWKLLLVVMAVIQLPMVIRSGIPNGVATAGTELVGGALTAWLILRPRGSAPARPSDQPSEKAAA